LGYTVNFITVLLYRKWGAVFLYFSESAAKACISTGL